MLKSIGKDGGSQIKGNVMLIVLVDFFFFFLRFVICFLLVFIMLFELLITWKNSALCEVVSLILIGGGKGVIKHKVK